MSTVIVNGRVDSDTMSQATRVLEAFGTSASQVIRNLMEFIAKTGCVPEYASSQPVASRTAGVQELTRFLETRPMPGWVEGVSDEEILSQERMTRYGY